MPKSLRLFVVLVCLTMLSPAAWGRRPVAAKTQYRWARMSIVRALPSQVFARLGLTHTTRYGFTRDGHTKKTPDPTFPVGLTDIVPYDVSHLLLVRGTPQALAQFRLRVLATENEIVATGRWHVGADLLTGRDLEAAGPMAEQDVVADLPIVVSVGDPDGPRTYRLCIHTNADATTTVTCQTGLLPTPTGGTLAVLTPAQVWTPLVTQAVPPGGVVTFDDRASDRQSSLQKLNLPAEARAQDYRLRLTLTPPPVLDQRSAPLPDQGPAVPPSVVAPTPEEKNAP